MVERGFTPREVAARLRVGKSKVLGWIHSGELSAVNTASKACGKPQYVVTPEVLHAFIQRCQVVFKYAGDNQWIDRPVVYGASFKCRVRVRPLAEVVQLAPDPLASHA